MHIFDRKPAARWLAPLALVLVIGGTGGLISASADPPLPPKTAQQLLVDLQRAEVDGLSGTVVQTSDLGIPDLLAGGGDSDLSSLVSGTHSLRVWYAGPDKARVALDGTFGESDVIRNGDDVWIWSSKENTATHRTLSASDEAKHESSTPEESMTPETAANKVLEAIGPTTEVTTNGTATVAGRAAYELMLRPKDDRTLVREVRIAVDSEESIPLRVQVVGSQQQPAFEVAYSKIEFGQPDPAQFTFNPPPGAKVTEVAPHDGADHDADRPQKPAPDADRPTIVGQGWTTVVVAKTGDLSGTDSGQLGQVLNALPRVSGGWGSGRLLKGTAFSVLLTDDGRLAAGSVEPELLYQALAR
ncbi:MAG TPA: sigma-E factor regulatory protein RseB domain-containing protein [Propionibacteriaceae bacterium]|nr:sigma-E factor regulatory protein RseB domain-containing protein [Propionibacteriaceae bacterium]